MPHMCLTGQTLIGTAGGATQFTMSCQATGAFTAVSSSLLHPVQEDITNNGTQCGFCTLGWVLNIYSLLENNSHSTRELVEQNESGNLPRCTGCRPILRRVVLWQAHHHSYAVGHGRPRSRPLQFPDPFPIHPLFFLPRMSMQTSQETNPRV